jgi:hypothetical protein
MHVSHERSSKFLPYRPFRLSPVAFLQQGPDICLFSNTSLSLRWLKPLHLPARRQYVGSPLLRSGLIIAQDNYTPSIVTTEYSKGRLSEQSSRESQHQAQAEEDDGLFSCIPCLRLLKSFLSDVAPEKQSGRSDRSDRFDRLTWEREGPTQPGVVNNPTNELNQNTHPHTRASCEESFLGSCPHYANIHKCPRIATDGTCRSKTFW